MDAPRKTHEAPEKVEAEEKRPRADYEYTHACVSERADVSLAPCVTRLSFHAYFEVSARARVEGSSERSSEVVFRTDVFPDRVECSQQDFTYASSARKELFFAFAA